jgi:hypothetical protein
MIETILHDVYGVGLLAANPTTVLWAADRIADTETAKKELRKANRKREKMGRMPAYPEYGTRLF